MAAYLPIVVQKCNELWIFYSISQYRGSILSNLAHTHTLVANSTHTARLVHGAVSSQPHNAVPSQSAGKPTRSRTRINLFNPMIKFISNTFEHIGPWFSSCSDRLRGAVWASMLRVCLLGGFEVGLVGFFCPCWTSLKKHTAKLVDGRPMTKVTPSHTGKTP